MDVAGQLAAADNQCSEADLSTTNLVNGGSGNAYLRQVGQRELQHEQHYVV